MKEERRKKAKQEWVEVNLIVVTNYKTISTTIENDFPSTQRLRTYKTMSEWF